jgi:glutamate N-acetyltransferase/amino-acid N-acetyltransferase
MSTAVSPLAPTDIPDMPAIAGVKLAIAAAGIRYQGRTDVLLAILDKGTTVAGVFTKSKCPSAPVEWCRAKLKGGKARALVVNSGNRLQRQRGVSRLHRRDRRAARRQQIRSRARRPRGERRA